MLRMSVPGERSEAEKAKPVVGRPGALVLDGLGVGVTVNDAVHVAGKRAASGPVVLEAAADDALEVTLEGGVKFYLPAGQAPELLAAPPGRAAVVPGTVPLSSTLAVGDGTRGVADWAIEGLRVIGIDLAGKTAAAVAERVRPAAGAGAGPDALERRAHHAGEGAPPGHHGTLAAVPARDLLQHPGLVRQAGRPEPPSGDGCRPPTPTGYWRSTTTR